MNKGFHNCFGKALRLEIYGASHAPSIGVHIEGLPAGIPLSEADFEADLRRRRSGAVGTTARREADIPILTGGVVDGVTTGERLTISFNNGDARSSDYDVFRVHPRPSHVDYVARQKWGDAIDLRGSGMFSGRMTLALVAAGVVAKKIVKAQFATRIIEIGGSRDSSTFEDILLEAKRSGDSVGGVVESCVEGLDRGIGEPFFDSVESIIAHLMFSIPGVKGVEFGSGFEGVRLRGSERNDRYIDAEGHTASNNEGGIVGGLTNGNALIVRVAFKPTPSIAREQQTYNFEHHTIEPLQIHGRHDACIALRGAVVVESVVAIALAELILRDKM